MNKQLLIVSLIVILSLVGGVWLSVQNESPDQIENTVEKEDNTANSANSVGNSLNEENNIDARENDSDKVVIYFFWGDGCPHCAVEKPFLEEMEQKYPELEVKMFETWKNRDNAELFQKVAVAYGIQARGVPTTFIGDYDPIVGFADYMKEDLESKIKNCLERGCVDPGSKLE